MEQKKVAFTTLGCKVNLYDTEAMMEIFQKEGYEIADFEEVSDIYIINTCTVTNLGDKKSRQMIRRAKRLNPEAIVVACGCYAQVAPEEVSKIEGVNIVIGTKERSNIVSIIREHENEASVFNAVSDIMKEKDFEPLFVSELKDRTRAYLKIQEGCNRFCSYCIIPFARGPVRSRKPEDVINEVRTLAQNGFKEVVLTGIHVASYGVDFNDEMNLIKIIKMVHEIDGIERIRFSSVEPNIITDEFISEIKALPKVCRHFHLSLQSGCDKTLKKMNRHYTSEMYFEAVSKLRMAFEDVAVTTDIIVGFPDEDEVDFKESYDFAKKTKLSKIHVFPFSPKKGTAAAKFKEQVESEIKNRRAKEMLELSKELELEFFEKFKGEVLSVLFEAKSDDNTYEGHTSNYIKVKCESDRNIVNRILDVRIEKVVNNEFVLGKIVQNV